MLLEDCSKIRDDVRDFFKLGNKSSNKRYFVKHNGSRDLFAIRRLGKRGKTKEVERADRRERGRQRSKANRVKDHEWDSLAELVELLFAMPETDRSGNCQEMAAISAYMVYMGNHAKPDSIYYASITKPGDHAFCLVRQSWGSLPDAYSSVSEFTHAPSSRWWFVIDPWLNVVCRANEYLFYAHVMLEKWGIEGKRVAWMNGAQGPGWYPPNGEYRTKFKEAPMNLLALG
jgi:hypothetical protein